MERLTRATEAHAEETIADESTIELSPVQQETEQLPTRQSPAREDRRQAVEWFEQGLSRAEVARRLGLNRSTTSRWYKQWQQQGMESFVSVTHRGVRCRITSEQIQQIEQALLAGPLSCGFSSPLWTLARIAELIVKKTGVRYHPGHVWHLLHRMGFSCQKPQVRAKQRNEAAIEQWVKVRWPEIKGGSKRTRVSASS